METSTLLTIGGVLGILVSGYTIVTFWMKLSDRITKANAKAEAAETAAHNASIAVAAAHVETDRIRAELVEHRVSVAREYVSHGTLEKLESRVIGAIDGLGRRLDDFFRQNGH